MKNRDHKLKLAQDLIEGFKQDQQSFYKDKISYYICYHGINFSFISSSVLYGELQKLLPPNWFYGDVLPPVSFIKILAISPHEKETSFEWDDLEDANCSQYSIFNREVIIQRDFLFIDKIKEDFSLLVCSDLLQKDGFFNFLRYFLPRKFLNLNKMLMHSSCVTKNQKAYLFLGVSGAGKTTMASLCQGQGANVLGDDMNILTFSQDKLLVEGAALGQELQDKDLLGQEFEIESIYLLKKGKNNKEHSLPFIKQYLSLYTSFSNVFYSHIESDDLNLITKNGHQIIQSLKIKELEFNFDFCLG